MAYLTILQMISCIGRRVRISNVFNELKSAMYTIRIIISALLLVFFHVSTAEANYPKIVWYKGHLTLWDNTVLEGDVAYNWSAEAVLLRQADGRIRTFSASQVSQFGWFDYSQHEHRRFVALTVARDNDHSKQVIFERCLDGSLVVIRRIRPVHGLNKWFTKHPMHYTDRPVLCQDREQFEYFVYDADRLLALDRFYTDIYERLMTNHAHELQYFIRQHNLNDRTLLGRLVLINQYNFLVQQDAKTASIKEISQEPANHSATRRE